jgi:hypothetical protein
MKARNEMVFGITATAAALSMATATACSASNAKAGSSSASSVGAGGAPDAGSGGGGALLGGASSGTSGPETCEEASASKSYIGCEYWPTVTLNGELNPAFSFAVTIANATAKVAAIDVDRDGSPVAHEMVEPDELKVIGLPWVDDLRQERGFDGSAYHSALVPAGAYHLVSSVPVTVVQFNPLEFERSGEPFCDRCYSYSNDASILLPTTALRDDYFALSYPTLHKQISDGTPEGAWENTPGFVTVTATVDGTAVTVASTSHVRAGPGLDAFGPGASPTYKLDRGDVLLLASGSPPNEPTPSFGKPCVGDGLLLCPTGAEYDFTGTHIVADRPIGVLAGHACSFLPYDKWACDHLEETMLTTDSLGQEVIVTAPAAPDGADLLPTYVRVLSASDANAITFEPPLTGPKTLGVGEWIELGPFTEPYAIRATGRIAVAQYMPGAEALNGSEEGDPSQSTAVPVEQYRTAYTFLASPTFTSSYVDVIAATGAKVTLDGQPIPLDDCLPIAKTTRCVATRKLDGGVHRASAADAFGLVVYGYAAYTSYMMPGGMDVRSIAIPK